MNGKKWLAINLRAPTDLRGKEDLLLVLFEKIISKFREKLESWHFLWEPKPYPHTLLLRFYGNPTAIDKLKEAIYDFLSEEGVEYDPDKTYDGEAARYGIKGWKYVMKILHLGSNFALDLINKERQRKKNEEFSQPLGCYIDRWIHLFLNQLLTREIAEHEILFKFSIHRYVIYKIGEKGYHQVSKELAKEAPKFFNSLTESVDDFLKHRGSQLR